MSYIFLFEAQDEDRFEGHGWYELEEHDGTDGEWRISRIADEQEAIRLKMAAKSCKMFKESSSQMENATLRIDQLAENHAARVGIDGAIAMISDQVIIDALSETKGILEQFDCWIISDLSNELFDLGLLE